ncbi:hypothetical protein BZA70DRAFT_236526, partial [Myxozyma melibiosi]
YCGADPTAKSLHVGNLVPLLAMLHFGIRGHDMIGLVGGATVEVGDPSGRATERTKMEDGVRLSNEEKISLQMKKILENAIAYAKRRGFTNIGKLTMANNADWWKQISFLGFMDTVGRHLRVQEMLKRQSVQSRIESEAGIGYNEFTYQAMQAYDFFHLHHTLGCRVQVGGSDQYGNIISGVDLTARLQHAKGLPKLATYGVTTPLLTTTTGEKLGKSAGNAVWLDPELTSPFALYQYFVRIPDADVEKYLKILTLMPLAEIAAVVEAHAKDESLRVGQHALAKEVTDMIHGDGAGDRARVQSSILFAAPNQGVEYDADTIIDAFEGDSQLKHFTASEILGQRLMQVIKLVDSRSGKAIKELIAGGGVYAGPKLERITDVKTVVSEDLLIDGRLLLLRLGKANMRLIALQ